MGTPLVHVGILTSHRIAFVLNGNFSIGGKGTVVSGEMEAGTRDGKVCFQGGSYDTVTFHPREKQSFFTLKQVKIGVDFHWERVEEQSFTGILQLAAVPEGILVINQIDIESYLASVISSEMSASASGEFLKAHAVISRSWLLAQLDKNKAVENRKNSYQSCSEEEDTLIRWYDREDHTLFDVCADDHCQRYQGISRATRPLVNEVIRETAGEVLLYDNRICDTRFSKCCGGVTEAFEYCWEPVSFPYLAALRDGRENTFPDLREEAVATAWIEGQPDAFCRTTDPAVLSQVLNNYDQETRDFYRWEVVYTQEELAGLIRRKSGKDVGRIISLEAVSRGLSGRIDKLRITGTKKTMVIGKELEIRRTLSGTHLYSSAFTIHASDLKDGIPGRFVLKGAGWGHGVGLCQIGAAVMGEKGYSYDRILAHYYPGAVLAKAYGRVE